MTHEPPESGDEYWMETNDWVVCENCGNTNVLFNAGAFDGGGWASLLFCPDCGHSEDDITETGGDAVE